MLASCPETVLGGSMSVVSRRSLVTGLLFAPAIISSPASASARVAAPVQMTSGSIIVINRQRKLYFSLGDGSAISYNVAVGRLGKQWLGTRTIVGKFVRPAWSPPAEIRRDNPRLPTVIPSGSPSNPMGERAMTLSDSEYAIHGTNQPGSIGRFASYGCVRMHNHDVIDLYDRVWIGAAVTMLP
jgi:lipoprotein-anchoring transpeptidase ErfK/SrfK